MYLETTNFIENISNIDFILSAVLIVLLITIGIVLFKRALVRIVIGVFGAAALVCLAFKLNVTAIVISFGLILFISVVGLINAGAFRNYVANPSKTVKTFKWFGGKNNEDKILIDQDQLLAIICDAVGSLSKTKTGALITFERKDSLEDYIKTGTIINAPVTKEIIQTIFYPGTRLHDGAIVIRDGIIVSASVYYTPTTKPLAGKYGARHRAAMGISEATDAITIVVSEETGRISIAANGELVAVALDNIYRVLEDYFDAKD